MRGTFSPAMRTFSPMSQNILGSLLSGLQAAGLSATQIPSIMSSVAGNLVGGVSSQVNADLTQLMALVNNPAAYSAASPGIITKIESINGLPTTVLPLLESLRNAATPLQVAQTITSIEAIVSAQTSIL